VVLGDNTAVFGENVDSDLVGLNSSDNVVGLDGGANLYNYLEI
jgi:hypothetical protein